MSFHRTLIRLSALLAVVALAKGCGDGESPSAPPMPEPARPRTVTVSPATTELTVLGATVQLSAEVRDQNDRVMAGATVTWTSSANSVATVDAAGLVRAVGNGTATITASAGSASGSAAVTVAVGVPPAPDLVVGSPSVSNSSPDAGASFTLSATVRNQGDGSSAATTLRYYRSINNRITTGDTEVDTDAVSALSASGTSAESSGLTAPSSPGTYYYGVCVDAVTGESDTSNNCSSAVTVTVGVPPPEPARPTTVTVSPATTELTVLGATVQLSAEVRDQNDRVMAGATVTWTSSASSVATVDAAGLVRAVGNGTATITASAGSASGSAAVTIAVGVPPAPDLVVGSPSVSNSSPVTGASFTLSATVRNQGSGPSAATTLRYYRSTDATITTGDTEVGTDAVGTLAASGTSDESIDLTAPSIRGTYYYGACVDDVTGESDTSNNCSSAVTVTVGVASAPDLVVESPSVSDSSPIAGASFTLSATVRNQGDGSSAATTLRYYRSTDATISGTDTQVDTDAVSALSASGTSAESIDLTAPSSRGTYYYGACVDDVTGESDTSNNCSSAVTIAVGVPPAPDLVVGSPSVSNSSPVTGESFTLSATVRNQGSGPSAATTLRYYRSTDATITTGDTEVGTDAVSALAASGTSDESIDLTAPSSRGTYYYGACVDDVTGESDTSNNCFSAVTVTVGVASAPDLVVESPSVSDSSPIAGASFTLSATVRNQGSGPSAATTLRYYRSTDATISGTDTQVDTDAVSALSASGTSAESIDLTAPSSPGTYYYGACVDDVTGESDTSNNCSSAVTIAVGVPPAPDLVVGSPSVSNSSPVTGASFTLSATGRNQGSGPSAATTLRYYRSTDATISGTDTQVGTDAVGSLAVSGTSDESIGLTAPSSVGTYYYGACVDAVTGESDTSNNCSSAVTVTIRAPDLVVESPSVSDNSPIAGASFTLSTTVRNQGDGSSAATTLRYYRSTDATISGTDTQVDTDAVSALSASGTSAESIDLTAPSSPGTYYYGACVDDVTDESDTSNNCSSAVTIAVGVPPAPDLVVGSPSVSNSTPVTGASFTLSATVRNQGSGPSAATTLRYYYRTRISGVITTQVVGTDAVGTLAASGTSDESIDLTAPSSAGTYYYDTCVDDVTGESDTSNNCSSAVTVTVGVASTPDLVVESPSVSDSSPIAGASFTLNATVRNQGDGSSAATTLRYYRSTDATISGTDTQVGTDAVGSLAASGTSDESIDLTAPSSPGTYYYGACVDAVTGESDTSNNCSDAVTVTVGAPAPDLVIESPSVSDSSPFVGASFTFSATVRNRGTASSAATTLRSYLSTRPNTIEFGPLGTDAVDALAASATSDESIDLTAPSPAGTYYYSACVGAVTGESDTSNNCSTTVAVTVSTAPDLVVGSPSVSDSSPDAGASFTFSATVHNFGTASSAATTLRYYRSADATISGTDTQVGTDAVGALSRSGNSAESIDLTAPSSPGTYYYGACVDAVTGESDTSNNCSDAVTVTVGRPDLVVESPSVDDDSPEPGGSFTLSATVRNSGDVQAVATTLRYYLSADATISTGDTQVGTDAVGALAASATSDESIDLTAPSSVGTYYYGACVNWQSDESDTSNNCSSAVTVTVRIVGPAPDLVVESPSVPDIPVVAGASFTLGATVRNQGSGPSAATTLRYYRTATIFGTKTEVGTDAVGALAASATSAESIDLTAPASVGTYSYGACVDAVTGESDTSNNCGTFLSVTVVNTIGASDLVVGSPLVSDSSPDAGASFTLSVTMQNQGDGPSPSTTLRFYRSTDATITTGDTEVGTDVIGTLAASVFTSGSTTVTAPASADTYYYGACVDAVTGESDTSNNCSSSVQVDVTEPPPPSTPDLVVGSPSVSNSSPLTGASFTLSATVRNQGSGPSAATTLRYYRSADATISGTDTEVGTDAVGSLAASGTSDESIGLTAPSSPGTYYYGACVDDVTGESDTSNNCSSSVQVDVTEPPPPSTPDLVVGSPSVNDDSPETGGSFTLSATVSNDGDGGSAATTLRYYRSADATISGTDTQVGTDAVGALAASATSAESIDLTAPSQEGTYYYGACVDAVDGESTTDNNCSDGVEVEVSGGGAGRDGECVVGATYAGGESCDVYGTGSSSNLTFTVLSDGRASLGFITGGTGISMTGTINGVKYHFVASHQGGGIWEIDEYIP